MGSLGLESRCVFLYRPGVVGYAGGPADAENPLLTSAFFVVYYPLEKLEAKK